MTRRYVTAWYHDGEWRDEDTTGPTSISVVEPEPEPRWTGLFNARGHKIMAVEDRRAVGFFAGVKT